MVCDCDNILPKTIVFILTVIFYLLGTVLMSFGFYTFHQYKDASFFDAYLVTPFATNATDAYIELLRRDFALDSNATTVTDAELAEAFNAFADNFDILARKTVVAHAWDPHPVGEKEENYRLSYFLEGFRAGTKDVMKLIEKNCKSDACKEEVARAKATKQRDLLQKGGNPVLTNIVNQATQANEDLKDVTDDALEQRRREEEDQPNPAQEPAEAEPEQEESGDKNKNLKALRDLITSDKEHLKLVDFEDDPNSEIDEGEFTAGFETADTLRSFKLNWGVILVIGAIFFALGTLTYCALKDQCMAIILAVLCFGLAIFLLLNYLSSVGVSTAREALEKVGMSGTIMDAQDKLNDNPTAKAALDSILGFWQPWYMLVASIIMFILAIVFIKLVCCSSFFIAAGRKVIPVV